jgi:hypothetical protein
MAESDLNDRLRSALAGYDPVRVENSVGPGTPDINFSLGWIESKQVAHWPSRADTVLALRHYTTQQRAWHVKRRAVGGVVWVAIEVHGETFIFDARDAAQGLGITWTRADMYKRARYHSPRWNARDVRDFLTRIARNG